MANLAWSGDIEDRVALLLFGTVYSSISGSQQKLMDGQSAATPPTKGVAVDAWRTVTGLAQWYELAGAAVSNVIYSEAWLVYETCYLMSLAVRPERIADFDKARALARKEYTENVSRLDPVTGYDAAVFTPTLKNMRFYALDSGSKRNPPVFLSPAEVDAATFQVLTWLWNKTQWNFRKRAITIDIPTAGAGASPTINCASGETFSEISSRKLYYSDTSNDICIWCDADTMARLKSNTAASTGKPQLFRVELSGSTYTWQWYPAPDAAYTVRCEVLIDLPGTTTPGVPTSETDTVPFAKLPVKFKAIFKDLVYGKALANRGADDTVWKAALEELERAAPSYDDRGNMDIDSSVRDVYHDVEYQGSYDVGGGM